MHLYDGYDMSDEDGNDIDISDEVLAAWGRLFDAFEEKTGLGLTPCCEEKLWCDDDIKLHDYLPGWKVEGCWQLTEPGKRFFGVKDKEDEQ